MREAWIKALRFAARPGAVSVSFERRITTENSTPTIRYRLTSLSQDGQVIGDDRDYDLLKAAMTPLENLAEAQDHKNLKLTLDLKSGQLSGLPDTRKS